MEQTTVNHPPTYFGIEGGAPFGVWHMTLRGTPPAHVNTAEVEVKVWPRPGAGVERLEITANGLMPISTRFLHRLKLGEMERSWRQYMLAVHDDSPLGRAADQMREVATTPPPRRRKWTPVHRARLCADYVRAVANVADPIGEVARMHHISKSQVRNLIATARNTHGLLTATVGKKAGGDLTPKALALLDASRD